MQHVEKAFHTVFSSFKYIWQVFNFLKNKGDNKNYHLIYKHLKVLQVKNKYILYKDAQYEGFIQQIINMFPQYKQIMCDCLTTHLNHLFKTSIIKAIHSL